MQAVLYKRLLSHISSLTLAVLILGFYLIGNTEWIDTWLPINGKPLAIFTLLVIVIVYELSIYGNKVVNCNISKLDGQIHEILKQMEVNRLIQAVNAMYGRFESSGDVWLDNEYSIKELNELKDMRQRLNVNSYTQGRLEYLCTKIKRN